MSYPIRKMGGLWGGFCGANKKGSLFRKTIPFLNKYLALPFYDLTNVGRYFEIHSKSFEMGLPAIGL